MGGDIIFSSESMQVIGFQLTPPMWVATQRQHRVKRRKLISTHATHVGGDLFALNSTLVTTRFQLTPPMWVATSVIRPHLQEHYRFQLTPPMWVATLEALHEYGFTNNFNSRHPCGWRPDILTRCLTVILFQLTPPMWVATREHVRHH